MQTFGARLKRIRKERGLSQGQLAKKSGVYQQAIGAYERNQMSPTLKSIEWLCGALGLTASELLGF